MQFNARDRRPRTSTPAKSPIKTGKSKGELFLMAVSNLGNESALSADSLFVSHVRKQALKDPDWVLRFLRWLRVDAYIRTASIVGAAQAVHARLEAHEFGGNRQIIDAVIQRGDEMGEMIGYWRGTFTEPLPSCVKRGIGDAMIRLGTQFNFLKYGRSDSSAYSWRDILNLVHAGDKKGSLQYLHGETQHVLFDYVVRSGYLKNYPVPNRLKTIDHRQWLMSLPVSRRRDVILSANATDTLRRSGMTHEALAGWLQGPMDKAAWEAIIPLMSYAALLKNLRNFDQAGVSDEVAQKVAAKLSDPDEVAGSKQFPMRILSAYRAAPNLRWAYPLQLALDLSLRNIDKLPGNTLIMVDTSHSMEMMLNDESSLQRWDSAVLFGAALANRCERADVVSFSGNNTHERPYQNHWPVTKPFPMRAGESILKTVERWKADGYFIGGWTETAKALETSFAVHNRVIVLTDDDPQGSDPSTAIPSDIPMYTWNLAGHVRHGSISGEGNRHSFAGLTDAGLKAIPLLERGRSAAWPF